MHILHKKNFEIITEMYHKSAAIPGQTNSMKRNNTNSSTNLNMFTHIINL